MANTNNLSDPEIPCISIYRGRKWKNLRRQLLHGSKDGSFNLLRRPDAILRYSNKLEPEIMEALLALPEEQQSFLKKDLKRSVTRAWLDGKSYVLKYFYHLHRWVIFSPDCKAWLGAHRLQDRNACYAWFRRNDNRLAIIIYEDAGDLDLYMPRCLSMPLPTLQYLFAQAGTCIALLHEQQIFHADTKPGNFVFHSQDAKYTLSLIDKDDVRLYSRLAQRYQARNLAQFIGCSQPAHAQAYVPALQAFMRSYCLKRNFSPPQALKLFPEIRRAMQNLYPERETLNSHIYHKLEHFLMQTDHFS